MAKTNWQDPKTSEVRSTHISGLQEAVGKLEDSVGLNTVFETDIPMTEVFISNDDRCRIYQAPEGKRNWLLSPAPIIKKNGSIITDDFEIDYGGGAVIFSTPISEADTVSADATYTKKVEGKGLSTNDYTDGEKDKLNKAVEHIGNIKELTTTNKENLVKAINEVNNKSVDLTPIENRIGTLETDLNEHIKDIYENEVHGMRILDGKLEYWDVEEEKWKQIAGGGGSQVPLGNVVDFTAEPDDGKVILRWKDPEDIVVDGIVISKWAGTKILRKTGSYPANENDGVLVVDSGVRNQYEIDGFVDTGLENNIEYFYMAFPYTTDGLYTLDIANRVSAMPTDYDDLTGSPGSPFLIAGDMQEGFFGEVPSSELITGDALASQVGISQGNSQHSAAGWLKFAWKGKILFIAKKPIRNSISWDAINTAKCVYGDSEDKTVEIGGLTYKVRLMRALEPSNDPKTVASAYNGTVNHYSEWNRLMCQIHEQAIDKSWDYPDNIENDIGILEHNLGSGRQGMYSDADLVVKSGDGRASWCQEMGTSTSYRLHRGLSGVSYSLTTPSSNTGSGFGWRPVLELVS